MCCVRKFCYRLEKTAPETVKLIKKTYKEKCFSKSAIFRWHSDVRKGRLSKPILVPKPDRPENVVNDQNAKDQWVIFRKDW